MDDMSDDPDEPVGSCDECGADLWPDDDDALCDSCLYYAESGDEEPNLDELYDDKPEGGV